MLFMSVFTWDPSKRDEVIKRRTEGPQIPESAKLIDEWVVLGRNQVFRLMEADKEIDIAKATLPWTDTGNINVYPVMTTDEMFKQLGLVS